MRNLLSPTGKVGDSQLILSDQGFSLRSLKPALWLDYERGVYSDSAASFMASDHAWLECSSNPSLQTGNEDWCWCGWVKSNALGAYDMFVTKGTGTEFELRRSANYPALEAILHNQSNTFVTAENALPGPDVWFFFASWHDATADSFNLQVNNGATHSVPMVHNGAVGNAPVQLGHRSDNAGSLTGAIDSTGFWKRVLTPEERTWLYNAGSGRSYSDLGAVIKTNLVSWWDLNEPGGTRYDSHGYNHLEFKSAPIVGGATRNGNFETLGPGGNDVFAEWSEGTAGAIYSIDTQDPHSGSRCLKVRTGGSGYFQATQDVLTVGRRYRATFWARASEPGVQVASGAVASEYVFVALSTEWAQYTVEFRAVGATAFQFYGDTPNTDYFVDDVTLEALDIPLASGIASGTASIGDPVALWMDRSGNGRHATQSVFSKRPMLSAGGLLFDPVDDWLLLPDVALEDTSVFAVCKWNSLAAFSAAIGLDSGTEAYLRLYGDQDDLLRPQMGVFTQLWQDGVLVQEGVASRFEVASVLNTHIYSVPQHQSGKNLSLRYLGSNETNAVAWPGRFVELIVCPRVTTMQRQQVEAYLAKKHGITLP